MGKDILVWDIHHTIKPVVMRAYPSDHGGDIPTWASSVLEAEASGNPVCRMVFVLCTFGFINVSIGSVSVKFSAEYVRTFGEVVCVVCFFSSFLSE